MKFSALPWFIRSDIIDQVIEKRTVYALVSKEWAKHVAARHGKLRYSVIPESKVPISIITQEARKIEFDRSDKIDWDVIWNNKNIDSLSLEVSCEETSKASKELFTNCLLFPSIKRFEFTVDEIIPPGPKLILEKNQDQVEELTISTFSDKWHLALEKMTFSNLRHLSLYVRGNQLRFIESVSRFPSLSKLSLHCSFPHDPILFNSHELPSMTELSLSVHCKSIDGATRVNLANLPNIKKLELGGDYKFIGEKDDNNIELLDTSTGDDDLSRIMHENFTKIKTLNFGIDYLPNPAEFTIIFNFFKNLNDLQLELSLIPEIPVRLSVGSCNLTTLRLIGYFEVTFELLYWISNKFQLKQLFLHGCDLKDKALSEVLPFYQLQSVTIVVGSTYADLYRDYFSKANYPHIDLVEITGCRLCSHFLSF